MKIAMLGHKVIPSIRGGIETVLTNLCPILVEKGHDVTCYNRSTDKLENEFADMVTDKTFKGVKLKKALTLKMRGVSAMLASYTAAIAAAFGNYDIVHFHAEGPCAAMWIPKLFGKKCVATVHGLDWQRDKWGKGFSSKYIKYGEKQLIKRADEVIVLSENAGSYFLDTYNRQTVIIPNGISIPEKNEADIITEKYGLKKDDYICIISRLTEEKGIHYLIDAFKQIKTDKKLVICGETSDTDDYVAKLNKMAEGNDNIIFTGFITGKELSEMFSNAYVMCLPSNMEGMSMSLLESLSYGNCVLCSDIPENTSVAESYAEYFKKGSVEELKIKLQMLSDNPDKVCEYKQKAANYICSKYSWELTANATCDLYERVAGKKRKER